MQGTNSCCFFGLAACGEQVLHGICVSLLPGNIGFRHFT